MLMLSCFTISYANEGGGGLEQAGTIYIYIKRDTLKK